MRPKTSLLCLVCLKLYSSKALNVVLLAGLLTYSIVERPSHSFKNSGLSMFADTRLSLQQRVCSGFSPDSLFHHISEEIEMMTPKYSHKGSVIF
jgi:hypothetical protein